jgi:undecaprenyl-diphosphatase
MKRKGWPLFLSLFGFAVFMAMLENVLFNGPMIELDTWISMHVHALQKEPWTKMVIFVTDLNGVIASTILFVLITVFFWHKKRYGDLRFFVFSFLGATLLFNLLKFTVHRARPDGRLLDLATYSFPSGHTTMATVLALSLYFIFQKEVSSGLPRTLLLLATVFWPLKIAFTRVYLNVHWTSDVLAGLGLGIFWVTLIYMFYPPE